MRVFVTGASGHLGSAVIPELVRSGHDVVGLARSDAAAAAVTALRAEPLRGDLDDIDALSRAVHESDGVIHLAFKHDEMQSGNFQAAIDADLAAIVAMGKALAGTQKPFVGTSGTLMLTFGGVQGIGTEADAFALGPRIEAENTVVGFGQDGVRSSVIRLPPTVHSSLDHHGYVPTLISIARQKGKAGFVGDGSNRWPAVHTLDAARLYRMALEEAPAGTRLHAVGDQGVAFRDIASSIGRHLDVPTVSIASEDAEAYFDFLALFVALDNPTSSARTQELLHWTPTHPGLLQDLDEGHYFEGGLAPGGQQ